LFDFQAGRDLKITRKEFLHHFGFPNLLKSQNLQTRLFPIVADYLESMELCLRNVDELLDKN